VVVLFTSVVSAGVGLTLTLSPLLFCLFNFWLLYCNSRSLSIFMFDPQLFLNVSYLPACSVSCHLHLLPIVSADEASRVGSVSIFVCRGVNWRYLTLGLLVTWWPRHRRSWYAVRRAPPASWVLCRTQTLSTPQSPTFLLSLRCVLLNVRNITPCLRCVLLNVRNVKLCA
jgi:hypothetical protein